MSTFENLAKYNFWDGTFADLGYIRKEYLNRLSDALGNNLIKIITGQRRVGKSFVVRQFIKRLIDSGTKPQNIFYLPLEAIEFSDVKTFKDLDEIFRIYKNKLKPQGKIFIFIDEIQFVQGWEKAVSSWLQDFTMEKEIFITGSNSKLLSSELATLLSGRYLTIEILPFNYTEFCDFIQRTASRDSFVEYLSKTGMPEALSIQKPHIVKNYFSNLLDTIILRDILQRYNVKDISLLRDLFLFYLRSISNPISFTSIVKYYKSKGYKTFYDKIATYTDYLEQTFVIQQVLRYELKAKSMLAAVRKIYLNDLGFVNFLLGFNPQNLNYYLENYVANVLRHFGYNIYTGRINSSEIDFLAFKQDKTLALQVSWSITDANTYQREVSPLQKNIQSAKKIIVHTDQFDYSDPDIIFIKAWQVEEKLSQLDKLLFE